MKRLLPLIGVALLLVSAGAHAELSNSGLLTDIANRYQSAASSWASYIMARATWLYWVLVMISMVWTGGMMAIKGAGIQEFFAEFVRFIMFTGFFWWLLVSAPTFVPGIYSSMATIGSTASGLGSDLRPSGIVDIGFMVLNSVLDNSSLWEPIDSLFGFIMAIVILLVLSLTAVNMVVLLVSGWVVGYAGIIYLGFGGSRWTSEMAISFYKTVLAIGIQLMTMILLVGIGKTFLDDYYARMATGIELKEMAVLMVACLVLLILVNKVPQLMSSIASSNVGMSGLGSYGSGTALAAAGMAGAAAGVGASMVAAGAANIAGGASAIKAAFSQASANVSSGTDVMAKAAGAASGGGSSSGASGGGSGSGGAGTASTTPFAQVAGLNSTGGGASVSSIAGRSSSGGSDASGGGAASSSSSGGAAGGNSSGAVDGGTGSGEAPASSSASSAGEGGQSLAGSASSAPATSESQLAADPGTSSAGSSGDSGVSQAQSGQAGGDGGSSSIGGRAASAAAKAGRVAADAGANLAMGTWDVAKAAVASRMEQFGERIAETTGGKIAQAIHERGAASTETPTFSGDGFAAAPAQPAAPESTDPEVAAFVKRGNGS